ncbi:unnamed protein product [Toxocara canis]|uniref:RxLR effector protein n=1 Tax=Toxocara canis TaxID=6265 RepID=A0A183ULB0_TOXCA|nr:unnamed protein product [Toxocara canis]
MHGCPIVFYLSLIYWNFFVIACRGSNCNENKINIWKSVEARDLFARSAYKIIPRPKTTLSDINEQGAFIGRSSLGHIKATTQHLTLPNRHANVPMFRPYSSKIWHFWGDGNRTAIADAYQAYRKWLITYKSKGVALARAKALESESKKQDRHQQEGFNSVRLYTNAVYSGRSPETLRWLTKSIDAQRIASQTPRIFIPNGTPGSEGKLVQLPLSEVDEGSVD